MAVRDSSDKNFNKTWEPIDTETNETEEQELKMEILFSKKNLSISY